MRIQKEKIEINLKSKIFKMCLLFRIETRRSLICTNMSFGKINK